MPIVEVNGQEIEFPDNMSQDQIRGVLQKKFPAPAEQPKAAPTQAATQTPMQNKGSLGRGDAWVTKLADGIPFGLDAMSSISAALGVGEEPTFNERRIANKRALENVANEADTEYPVMAPVAGAYGSVASTLPLFSAKLLNAPSFLVRAAKGGLAAGTVGAVHGAGKGIGEERKTNAFTGGITAAPFGVLGSAAADIIGFGVGRALPLAKRAATLFNRRGQSGANIHFGNPSGNLNNQSFPLSNEIIPLTKGQSTQDAATQALEYGAQAGSYGDEAQKLALESRDIQSDAAKNVLSSIAGTELTPGSGLNSAEALKNALSQSYKASKAKTAQAYKDVSELSADGQLRIAGDYITNTMVPALDDFAKRGFDGRAFDLMSPKMSNAKRLYDQFAKFKNLKNVKTVDFFRMEDWRGRLSQGIREADKGSPEKAFLSGMLERYDRVMQQLPREAILNGDENIISAMEKARISRKEQSVLFERSKLVKDILQNDDLTNEQFYNTLSSLGNKSGTYVRDMLRTAAKDPDKQAALQTQIKQSIFGSILDKSLSSEIKAGGSVAGGIDKMVSFDKLATNLNKLIQNKSLYNQIITNAGERKIVEDAYKAASLIKSVKPGSKNYSNTAYTLLSFLNKISPAVTSANIAGIGLGSALKTVGESGAKNELDEAFSAVLKGIQEQNSAITNFGKKYGRQIMNAGAVSAEKQKK